MKGIICSQIAFNYLNESVTRDMKDNGEILNIWCYPIINKMTGEYFFTTESEGIRREIIERYINNNEVEISEEDENWFIQPVPIDNWYDVNCTIEIKLSYKNNLLMLQQYPELGMYIKQNNINSYIENGFVFLYVNFILPDHLYLLNMFID